MRRFQRSSITADHQQSEWYLWGWFFHENLGRFEWLLLVQDRILCLCCCGYLDCGSSLQPWTIFSSFDGFTINRRKSNSRPVNWYLEKDGRTLKISIKRPRSKQNSCSKSGVSFSLIARAYSPQQQWLLEVLNEGRATSASTQHKQFDQLQRQLLHQKLPEPPVRNFTVFSTHA